MVYKRRRSRSYRRSRRYKRRVPSNLNFRAQPTRTLAVRSFLTRPHVVRQDFKPFSSDGFMIHCGAHKNLLNEIGRNAEFSEIRQPSNILRSEHAYPLYNPYPTGTSVDDRIRVIKGITTLQLSFLPVKDTIGTTYPSAGPNPQAPAKFEVRVIGVRSGRTSTVDGGKFPAIEYNAWDPSGLWSHYTPPLVSEPELTTEQTPYSRGPMDWIRASRPTASGTKPASNIPHNSFIVYDKRSVIEFPFYPQNGSVTDNTMIFERRHAKTHINVTFRHRPSTCVVTETSPTVDFSSVLRFFVCVHQVGTSFDLDQTGGIMTSQGPMNVRVRGKSTFWYSVISPHF